jgi:hypothetical protein
VKTPFIPSPRIKLNQSTNQRKPHKQKTKNKAETHHTHIPLGILVRVREDRADLDVRAREAELVPGLEHAGAVGLVVVRREGEGGS